MTQESLPSHMRQSAQGPSRVLLISPTLADVDLVVGLLEPYAPERLVATSAVPQSLVEMCGRALGIELRLLDVAEPAALLESVAADAQGRTLALLVPLKVIPEIVTYALGVSDEAGLRFEFTSNAISVLECDADGRWAVVRVAEGAWAPGVH